ncbi:hypothetical protein [Intestinibacter sp.]
MSSNTVALTINSLSKEVKKFKGIKERKKEKYLSDLDKLNEQYKDLEFPDYFKTQYNQLNSKGNELLKNIRGGKQPDIVANDIPVYIRYLKASLLDFEGKTNNLKYYLFCFYITAALFMAFTPQFYSYVLPVVFIVPIFLGVRGCKQRSMNGFYMSMSVVPVGLMTAVTWIRYGIQAMGDYDNYVKVLVESGLAQGLAEKLIYIGFGGGILLLISAGFQLYFGIKNKDLFI